MNTVIYWFSNGLFYPDNENYTHIPNDAIKVEAKEFAKAMNRKPGESFSVDENGVVIIMSAPPVSQEQLIAQAEYERSVLMARADSEISWRQGAVDEGMATKEETAALSEWKKYRVLLMRVDTTTAPNISWPVKPE